MNAIPMALMAVLAAALAAPAQAQPRDRDDRDRGDVTLFDRQDFRGYLGSLDGPTPNFERHGFNDRAASIIVRRGRWEFCTDARYRGNCRVYGPGEHRTLHPGHDDAYSSARPVSRPGRGRGRDRGPAITLFDSANFSGRSMRVEGTLPNLEVVGFNDRAESVVVHEGRWRLCSDAHGGGRCRDFGPGRYAVLPPELRSRLSSLRLR